MSDVTSFHVTGDWRHIVDDTITDPDALPDEKPPTGSVDFTPIHPTIATAGDIAYTLAPVTALVAEGELTDLQGRPGVWLAAQIGEHQVRWTATVNLFHNSQKVPHPPIVFEPVADTNLTSLITTDQPGLPPLIVDQQLRVMLAEAETARDEAVAARDAAVTQLATLTDLVAEAQAISVTALGAAATASHYSAAAFQATQ